MTIEEFNNLVTSNFDIGFNYKDIYYEISSYEKEENNIISLADENKWFVEFTNVDQLDNYILIDKKIKDIIFDLQEDEIYY